MKYSVLSLFPEIIEQVAGASITGKALQKGLLELELIQIRDFAVNKYGKVDDYLFGGGTGMLMMAEPVYQAWQQAAKSGNVHRTIYLSPKGRPFDQKKAAELAEYDHLILLCGHYEGIDQRVIDEIVDEEISLGDYVLTGGELAACIIIDATARLIPGVLPSDDAYLQESHMNGLLEQPHYTRPACWHDREVPLVLLSGHQAKIERWQHLHALLETARKRPDLLGSCHVSERDWRDLIELLKDDENNNA